MLKHRVGTLATLAFLASLAAAGPAFGQRSWNYRPSRPTLSPYFGFFQINTTPLPNYQALVLPRQEIAYELDRESTRVGRLERQILLRETTTDLRGGGGGLLRQLPEELGEPARAASFMNLYQFYPNQQAVGRRR